MSKQRGEKAQRRKQTEDAKAWKLGGRKSQPLSLEVEGAKEGRGPGRSEVLTRLCLPVSIQGSHFRQQQRDFLGASLLWVLSGFGRLGSGLNLTPPQPQPGSFRTSQTPGHRAWSKHVTQTRSGESRGSGFQNRHCRSLQRGVLSAALVKLTSPGATLQRKSVPKCSEAPGKPSQRVEGESQNHENEAHL